MNYVELESIQQRRYRPFASISNSLYHYDRFIRAVWILLCQLYADIDVSFSHNMAFHFQRSSNLVQVMNRDTTSSLGKNEKHTGLSGKYQLIPIMFPHRAVELKPGSLIQFFVIVTSL